MVIMKRNSAGGSGTEDKAKTKREGKSRLKGKKLVDKEKAYEEARARIFGVCETTAADGTNNNDDGVAEKMPQLNPQSPEFAPQSNNGLGDSTHSVPSVASETPGSTNEVAEKSTEQKEDATSTGVSSESPKETAVSSDAQGSNAQGSNAASSTTSSSAPSASAATTKAVYRNRQQEENDPDFKRRSDIRPAYMTIPMVNGLPYLTANPYAPNNPYVNMVNMAMGQPHLPMSVIPGHPQPTHLAYYGHLHGQPPNPPAYNVIYPNPTSATTAPPQSPAYFVTSPPGKNYPTASHPHAIPPTSHSTFPSNPVPSAGKNAEGDAYSSSSSSKKSKSKRDETSLSSSPPNNGEGASKPPREESRGEIRVDGARGDVAPPLYTAEDFPALQ
jgi:hypothetical protein